MKLTLLVSLQAERVVTQLVRRSLGQRALRFLLAQRGPFGDVVACDVQPLPAEAPDIAAAVEHSISSVSQAVAKPPAGWDLEVKLGLAYARLGVLPLENVNQSAVNLAAIAGLWVRERLHLDPAAQELRWRMMGDRHLLVFCAPTSVLDLFTDLAVRQGMRLTSFLPAALPAVLRKAGQRSGRELPASRVLVWTESSGQGGRVAPVQLFQLHGRQLCADWRGWLPPIDGNTVADEALAGALARFVAANDAAGAAVEYAHWPLADQAGAMAS